MYSFNLIDPAQSDIRFRTMTFPDGQPHIKIDMDSCRLLDKSTTVRILCRVNHPGDLLLLLLVKNTLDYLEFERVEVAIAYLMAARMDRVMLDGEPFSLKVVAQMLNQGGFRRIDIFDPHSEVATALIDRSYAVTNHEYIRDVLGHYQEAYGPEAYALVSPDAGALKKIHKLAQYLGTDAVIECMKERDLKTGALTNFKTTSENLDGKTCFVVDDICDGGGTFAGTAALLKEKGAGKVILAVSHGIFSKGTDIAGIDTIYTTDSFRKVEGVHCLPVLSYL